MHVVKTIRYPQDAATWKRPEKIWLDNGRTDGYRAHQLVLMLESPYKDKHGHVLFEHDLVRWEDGELLELQLTPRTGWKVVPPADPENADFIMPEDGVYIELVGNVFQNRELLPQAYT
jgi:hypothetical protein